MPFLWLRGPATLGTSIALSAAGLFAVGALFEALEEPEGLRSRIEGAFRPAAPPVRMSGPKHYYRPYWLGGDPASH